MSKFDLSTVGVTGGARRVRIAAAATRFYAGEGLMRTPTYTTGAISVNTATVITDAKPRIATDDFFGVSSQDAQVNSAGTVIAHTGFYAALIPNVTRIRGRAKSVTNIVDTDANLILILGDLVDFDVTAGAHTIDGTAASNASALSIIDGNVAKGTLDVIIDARALRTVIS